MYEIHIEDGVKNKCEHCGAIYSIENDSEILYRNITLFYQKKESLEVTVKCKQCKALIKIS